MWVILSTAVLVFPDTFDVFEGVRSAISRIGAVHFLFLAVLVLSPVDMT